MTTTINSTINNVLNDVSRQVAQQANVQLSTKEAAKAALTPLRPTHSNSVYRHDPYSPVVPSPEEGARLMEERTRKTQAKVAEIHHHHQQQQLQYAAPMYYATPTFVNSIVSFSGFFEEPQMDFALPAPVSPPMTPQVAHAPVTKVYQNGRPVPMSRNASSVFEAAPMGTFSTPSTPLVPTTRHSVSQERSVDAGSFVSVRFRNRSQFFVVADSCRLPVSKIIDAHVIVDGDRGHDLGLVERVMSAAPSDEELTETDQTRSSVLNVQRLATKEEVAQYYGDIVADEKKAKATAILQAQRLLNHPLSIEHATFQFDRKKLTLGYTASERVYFVPLLKYLHQLYKCRIWMIKIGGEDDVEMQ